MKAWARRSLLLPVVVGLLWGCAAGGRNGHYAAAMPEYFMPVPVETLHQEPAAGDYSCEPVNSPGDANQEADRDGWTQRVVEEQELTGLTAADPELSYSISKQILARLNVRAPYYIDEDIKNGRPLKVPNDFSRYKKWTPLPQEIQEVSMVPKFVLIVKDIPFLGWYEHGQLAGDAHVCIGKKAAWTRAGIYKVRTKDIDHISRSYTNAFGVPAPMPWALRIYEHVWIHAGDITGGYCSHGCINLPLMPAQQLYRWADFETVVLVLESLSDLQAVLEHNRSNCVLFARECARRQQDSGSGPG